MLYLDLFRLTNYYDNSLGQLISQTEHNNFMKLLSVDRKPQRQVEDGLDKKYNKLLVCMFNYTMAMLFLAAMGGVLRGVQIISHAIILHVVQQLLNPKRQIGFLTAFVVTLIDIPAICLVFDMPLFAWLVKAQVATAACIFLYRVLDWYYREGRHLSYEKDE